VVSVEGNRDRLLLGLSESKFMSGLVDLDHVGDLMLADLIHVEEVGSELVSIYVDVPGPINVSR
jgi:hypothetical protein